MNKVRLFLCCFVAVLALTGCRHNPAEDYVGDYDLQFDIYVEDLGTVYAANETFTIQLDGDEGAVVASCESFSLTGFVDDEGVHFNPYTVETEREDGVSQAVYQSALASLSGNKLQWETPVSFHLQLNAGVTLDYDGRQSHVAKRVAVAQ